MKEKLIPLERFDLDGFYNWTIKFIRAKISGSGDPTFAIAYAEELDGRPSFGALVGLDILAMLLAGEGIFFFPFAGVDENRMIYCANGASYEMPEDYDPETDFFDVRSPLGREETLGFLMHRDGQDLVVKSAFWDFGECGSSLRPVIVGWVSIDLCNEEMIKLIDRFIKN
jgi:hypothetical protein